MFHIGIYSTQIGSKTYQKSQHTRKNLPKFRLFIYAKSLTRKGKSSGVLMGVLLAIFKYKYKIKLNLN